jgi:hypothetical protein
MRSPPFGDLRDWVEFAFGPCFHIGAGVGWVVGCVGAGAKATSLRGASWGRVLAGGVAACADCFPFTPGRWSAW